MSMYNMLHGMNPLAPYLLLLINMDQENKEWSSGRFRDIHLNEDGTKILLYTRNGGGNREHWSFDDYGKKGESCSCPGCIIDCKLPKHPLYITDYDDEYDCTYATIEFKIPEKFQTITKLLSTGKPTKTISEKFKDSLKEMTSMSKEDLKKDKRFSPLINLVDKIAVEVKNVS